MGTGLHSVLDPSALTPSMVVPITLSIVLMIIVIDGEQGKIQHFRAVSRTSGKDFFFQWGHMFLGQLKRGKSLILGGF